MKTLNELDAELFEVSLLVAKNPTSKLECPLLSGFKVSTDAYVERYRRWRAAATNKNEVRMVGFAWDDVRTFIARACYELNLRCEVVSLGEHRGDEKVTLLRFS